MKPDWIVFLASLVLFSGATGAAEFMYRDLMGNTVPSKKCSDRPEAEAKATDHYNITKHTKIFCETQGYGWHVAEQKQSGKLVCQECGDQAARGKYQCHVEDIVVTCKRLKPGSVGLFPGEG